MPPLILFLKHSVDDQPRDDHGRWTDGGGAGAAAGAGGAHAGGANGQHDSIRSAWKSALNTAAIGVALVVAAPIAAALLPAASSVAIGSVTVGVATGALAEATIGAVAEHAIVSATFQAAGAVARQAGVDPEHVESITKVAETVAGLSGVGKFAHTAFFKKSVSSSTADERFTAGQFALVARAAAAKIVETVKAQNSVLTNAQKTLLHDAVDRALQRFLETVRRVGASSAAPVLGL